MESKNGRQKVDIEGKIKELFKSLKTQLVETMEDGHFTLYNTLKDIGKEKNDSINNAIKNNDLKETKSDVKVATNIESRLNNLKHKDQHIVHSPEINELEKEALKIILKKIADEEFEKYYYANLEYNITKLKSTEATSMEFRKYPDIEKKAILIPLKEEKRSIRVKIENFVCSVTDDSLISFFFDKELYEIETQTQKIKKNSVDKIHYNKAHWNNKFNSFKNVFRVQDRFRVNEDHILEFVKKDANNPQILIARKIKYSKTKNGNIIDIESDLLPVGGEFIDELKKRLE